MTVVLFTGGGTGGHLMPALAIAEAMVEASSSVEPFFVGAERGIEARVLPSRPWRHALLPLEPLYRRRWWKNVGLPFALYRSLRRFREVLDREQPALVVGTGGYVAGPVVWAATNRGVPSVIQEQNARPGLATRMLARRARQIHLGYREAASFLRPGPDTRVLESGNPIVPPPSDRPARGSAKAHLGLPPDRPLVLVLGGSQGATAINRLVDGTLAERLWPEGVSLVWQTGHGGFEAHRARAAAGSVHVTAFVDPVAQAYAAADLVLARAGAMTLAELAAWGLPAILIPLPGAAAAHQLGNARALAGAGAALLLEQRQATPRRLREAIAGLLGDPARMADLSRALAARSHPDAAMQIARSALELVFRE